VAPQLEALFRPLEVQTFVGVVCHALLPFSPIVSRMRPL